MHIFGSYQNKSYEWVIRTLQKFFERKVFYTFVDTANWKRKVFATRNLSTNCFSYLKKNFCEILNSEM